MGGFPECQLLQQEVHIDQDRTVRGKILKAYEGYHQGGQSYDRAGVFLLYDTVCFLVYDVGGRERAGEPCARNTDVLHPGGAFRIVHTGSIQDNPEMDYRAQGLTRNECV